MTATAETLFTPAIIRTQDHRYYGHDEDGKAIGPFPGATGVLDVLGATFSTASRYGARNAAQVVYDLTADGPDALMTMRNTLTAEGFLKAIADSATKHRDKAALQGTDVHALAQKIVEGTPYVVPEHYLSRVEAYARWWAASGWTLRLAEALVLNPSVGYGGTFDLLARDRDGRTVLADVKTGNVYREAILQLCAYGMAPLVARPGDAIAYPMPLPDRYVILHVTEDNVREIEVSVGQAERMAFLDCLDLLKWTQSVKGRL